MSSSEAARVRNEAAVAGGRAAGGARQGRLGADSVWSAVLPVLAIVVVLALWQAITVGFNIPRYIFPRFDTTLASLHDHWGDIWPNLLTTLGEAASGFAIGNVLAIAGATAFVYWRPVERALFPIAVLIQTIPIVVWAPILVIIMSGVWPQIVVAILISFFPALVNMTRGLRMVSPLELELFHVLNASRWQVYRKLRWPASIPSLFSSLRITSTLSLVGAIVGEYVAGGGQGVGYALITAKSSLDTALVMAITLVVTVTGIIVFLIVAGLERLALGRRGQA